MEKQTPRTTQRDVAKAAGVGRATVSYALKGNPKIPPATREHILSVAAKLEYAPDPMLSSLAVYRSRMRPPTFHGSLAWLVYETELSGEDWWRGSPHYCGYFEGASRRTAYHGYKLEEFVLNPATMTSRRAAAILRARNISGLLLCPLPLPNPGVWEDFPWQDFSVVALGYTLQQPRMHTVSSAHYQNVRAAMQHLRAKGCQRIGLAIERSTDLRCLSLAFAAHHVEQSIASGWKVGLKTIPPCFDYNNADYKSASGVRETVQRLCQYVHHHRLDALLITDLYIKNLVDLLRPELPAGLEIAGISLREQQNIAGIHEDSEEIGAVAVDFLTGLVQRGERGVPEAPVHTQVEGKWQELVPITTISKAKSRG